MKKILSFLVSLGLGALSLTSGCANTAVSYQYENAELYSKGSASLNVEIDEIEISWASGSVSVVYYDGETVSFAETANKDLTDDTELYFRTEAQTLKLQYIRSGTKSPNDLKKDLTVYIPRGETLRELSLETVSADISLDSLAVTECEIENVSGDISVRLTELSRLSLQTVSGNAVVEFPTADELEVDSVSGNVTLRSRASAPRHMDAETVSGNVTLGIPRETGFSLSFETVSGRLNSDFPYEKRGNLYLVSGGANYAYDVETVSGNANILILGATE